ncbi:MAG: transglutaminase-like domain-containing protein [Bacteroidales bacterium]
MPNPTLAALINLMDEPDETAFNLIREQILLQGVEAVPPLENCLENSFNPVVQERLTSVIRQLNLLHLHAEFRSWLQTGSSDLLKGFMLVARIEYPHLDENEIIATIEQLKMDIWIELRDNLTALENIKVMNHMLFEIHLFNMRGNDSRSPHNNYVNTLLEHKKGNALSLGILFIILAQKVGLPVYGVDLPQHFILAYLAEPGIENPDEGDVLFYINPFSKGAVFTRRDIDLFIGQMKIKPEKSFFAPCTNPDIIRRLINNLIFLYNQSGEPEKAGDLENLLKIFE